MSDKCLLRVEKLLKESSINSAKKDDIINLIKIAQAEKKLTRIDEVNIDSIAKNVAEEIKIQKIKNKKTQPPRAPTPTSRTTPQMRCPTRTSSSRLVPRVSSSRLRFQD